MRRTYAIGSVLVLAVTALIVWIARHTYWEEYEDHGAPQGDALTNPFYAAQRLAQLLGARTQTRHEVVRLPPPQAVIVMGDWDWNFIPERRTRLQKWVSDGGHLVVSANLLSDETFDTWTGIRQKRATLSTGFLMCRSASDCPAHRVAPQWSPLGAPPAGGFAICHLSGWTYLTTSRISTWRLNDTLGRAQVVRVPIGRGNVTIVNTEPFTYQTLLCDDNARFFVAATELTKGLRIDFLTQDRGTSLLQLIWRNGSPVIALTGLLIALWLWRSGARFGPRVAAPDSARRSLAEQIRGTGQFTLRVDGGQPLYAAAVRAFNEAAARRLPHYERLSGEERVTALAQLTGFDPGVLSATLETGQRSPHELRKAIAVLETARRHIGKG